MDPIFYCFGLFVLLAGVSTLMFLAASMNSSRISQAEETKRSCDRVYIISNSDRPDGLHGLYWPNVSEDQQDRGSRLSRAPKWSRK